jgi:hypothetical protein
MHQNLSVRLKDISIEFYNKQLAQLSQEKNRREYT